MSPPGATDLKQHQDTPKAAKNVLLIIAIVVPALVVLAISGFFALNSINDTDQQGPLLFQDPTPFKQAPAVVEPIAALDQQTPDETIEPEPEPQPAPVTVSIPKPAPVDPDLIEILSTPEGARVIIDGEERGTTPFKWDSPNQGEIHVEIAMDGYISQQRILNYIGGVFQGSVELDAAAPEPESKPESKPVEMAYVHIASIPPVADVYLLDTRIGSTNVEELEIAAGFHVLRFEKDGRVMSQEVTLQPGDNPTIHVRFP